MSPKAKMQTHSSTPRLWESRAIYHLNDGQVGLWSDVVSIAVTA